MAGAEACVVWLALCGDSAGRAFVCHPISLPDAETQLLRAQWDP